MADPHPRWTLQGPNLAITESPVAVSILRLHRDETSLTDELSKAFGLTWPIVPNTVAGEVVRVAWLAPGEWAIFQPAEEIVAQVKQVCSGHLHHLADISASRRLWRVRGAHSRALIAKGCSLDTHPKAMSAEQCAQTVFAQTSILLVAQATSNAFDIVADASFAGHLRAWFADAAKELLQ
jgi:sarcosine oxidase subunit gamma